MAREAFVNINFQAKTLAVIEQANDIIAEYEAQGFTMTLRQLYYQFVSRDLMPNELKSYKRLIKTVSDARNAGLIDWDSIEDRTRELVTHNSWDSPEDIIGAVARQYREDIWADQIWRPEVWIEKAALLGVVAPICDEFRVPYFAHIGNNSQSEQYKAGKRFADLFDQGRIPLVLHLADHDPNGIDMTRDNTERLALYARSEVEVRRIALNIDQVRRYNPPPNFAKEDRHPVCRLCRAVRRGVLGTGCAVADRDRRSDPGRDRGHDRCSEMAEVRGRRAPQSRAAGSGLGELGQGQKSGEVQMNWLHQVKYKNKTIEIWQLATGQWQCCIATPGQQTSEGQPLLGIGPDADFDSLEAAVDAAMKMVDEDGQGDD